jgi:hypothetical protein
MRARTAGPRRTRVPYAGLSVIMLLAAVVTVAVPLVSPIGLSSVGHLLLLFLMASSWCHVAARRSQLPTADQVSRTDRRAPVLYLRSFRTERAIFSQTERHLRHPRWRRVLRPLVTDPNEEFLTLERYLSADINRLIGPFTALGDPTDRLAPEGAYRDWVPDDDWGGEVARRIATARCVLAEVRASPSLEWELRHIRKTGAHPRLFVVVSPYRQGKLPLRATVSNRIRKMQPGDWSDFANLMRAAGYIVPDRASDPGTVLGFDLSGRAYAVATGAVTAAQYVEPIAELLDLQTRPPAGPIERITE